ncbi:hypothetical protein H8705_06020 [Oscillospiraceae bacterium NSJ-64]|uniref:Uncharacterized protein n=1 Tax=Youxingia wuxianensis TaxID=2763678 RepID=A0A926IHC2_9FIRM|nr:hypothetical protein [Youxingia wuxianensis]
MILVGVGRSIVIRRIVGRVVIRRVAGGFVRASVIGAIRSIAVFIVG